MPVIEELAPGRPTPEMSTEMLIASQSISLILDDDE
jgi:hypothetical protein